MLKMIKLGFGCMTMFAVTACSQDMNQGSSQSPSRSGADQQAVDQINHGNTQTAQAQEANARMNANTTLSAMDRQFVLDAASGGMFEVQSSQLALQQSQDSATKEFAQRMIDDHTKANAKLSTLAAAKGVILPSQMQSKHQQMYDSLKNTSGAKFDQRYHELQVQAHNEAVNLFDTAGRNLNDSDLKQFAVDTLPTLQKHKDMLMGIHSAVMN
jgi:putative membrane protein